MCSAFEATGCGSQKGTWCIYSKMIVAIELMAVFTRILLLIKSEGICGHTRASSGYAHLQLSFLQCQLRQYKLQILLTAVQSIEEGKEEAEKEEDKAEQWHNRYERKALYKSSIAVKASHLDYPPNCSRKCDHLFFLFFLLLFRAFSSSSSTPVSVQELPNVLRLIAKFVRYASASNSLSLSLSHLLFHSISAYSLDCLYFKLIRI